MATSKMQRRKPGEHPVSYGTDKIVTKSGALGCQPDKHALDYNNKVAVAKNCTKFHEVDDPGRWMEDSHYTKPVNEGEIVIFRNENGFALVKVLQVTPRSDGSNSELKFKYELR